MAYTIPSQEHQQFIFDYVRSDIDRDLREAGIDEYVAAQGYVIPDAGNEVVFPEMFSKLVVSRHLGYSSVLADIDRDLDPLATTWTVEYEVGVRHEKRAGSRLLSSQYSGLLVSTSIFNGPREAAGIGLGMSPDQLATVSATITRLQEAKRKAYLPFITKSLLKIDQAGD